MSTGLYTFAAETKERIRKFRFSSSRASEPQALIVKISVDGVIELDGSTPISDMTELVDELPDNTPRFVLLSYPMELSDGRKSSPFVLVYYRPETATQSNRMIYAGAVELVRNEAGVSRVIDIEEADELEDAKGLITLPA